MAAGMINLLPFVYFQTKPLSKSGKVFVALSFFHPDGLLNLE